MGHEGEDPLIQEEREDRGQPSPALSPLIQNIGAVMLLLTNLLAGQQEQQVAQRQLQMMQTEALSTALRNLAQREAMPGGPTENCRPSVRMKKRKWTTGFTR